ncbi:MAG: Ger(x)C family spore germination protein [Bacillota bacterium]
MIVITLLVFPGCWDRYELENTVFITSLGVDREPGGELTLTAESTLPQPGGGAAGPTGGNGTKGPQGVIYQSSDKTLTAAVGRFQQIIGRKVFLGYVRSIVIGEDAAREDMTQILGFLDRNPLLRRSSLVLITPGRASLVLSTVVPRKTLVSEAISLRVAQTEQTGVSFTTMVGDSIFIPLATDGLEPIAARVIATSFPDKSAGSQGGDGGNTAEMPGNSGTQGEVAQKAGLLRVSGMAVFRETRLVGWLNEKESRGWGWIRKRVRRGYAVTLTPRSAQGQLNPVTFHLLGGKSSIKYSIDNDEVAVHVTVNVRGEVAECATGIDLTDPDIINSLESDLAEEIKSEVEAALEKGQRELESDIFGFGFQLFRQHSREWNQEFKDRWPELFPSVPIDVNVNASIENTGVVLRALKIKP